MAHLIDKDALVADIDKHLSYYKDLKDRGILSKEGEAAYRVVRILMSDINSLEVKDLPIWEKVSLDTGQTTLYLDGDKSYLERFGYRIDLKDLDKLPKKNLKAQKGE